MNTTSQASFPDGEGVSWIILIQEITYFIDARDSLGGNRLVIGKEEFPTQPAQPVQPNSPESRGEVSAGASGYDASDCYIDDITCRAGPIPESPLGRRAIDHERGIG